MLGVRASRGEPLMSPALQRRLASINAAAEYAGCSTKTIRRRIAEGELTGYRFGPRMIRVNLVEVDAAMRRIPTAGNAAC